MAAMGIGERERRGRTVAAVLAALLAALALTATSAPGMGAGPLRWTRQFGTPADDHVHAVAIDRFGDAYVAGETEGDLVGASAGEADAFVRKLGARGRTAWTRQFGTPQADAARGVAVDRSGRVFVVGSTHGQLGARAAGGRDAFLRAYGRSGRELWTRQFGTPEDDEATAIALGPRGDLVVLGVTAGQLGGSAAGDTDVFVRRYGPNGRLRWTRQFGTSEHDYAWQVAVDGRGRVFVAGETAGQLGEEAAGGSDAFVRVLRGTGTTAWTSQFGTAGHDAALGIAVSRAGSAFIVGSTQGSLAGAHAGGIDAFVRRSSPSGRTLWTRQYGTPGYDDAFSVALDGRGDVLVVGETHGRLGKRHAGGADAYIRVYGVNGKVSRTLQFGTNGSDYAVGVELGSSGSIRIVGPSDGRLDGAARSARGGYDVFVRRYEPRARGARR